MTVYSTRTVWRDMDCDNPKVIWRHLIWFAQCIPRHSFVLWMAIQNRLMTQDRVVVWKPNEHMKCVLCDQCPDSHDHLFFACLYSSLVWNEMLKTLSKRIISDWNNTVEEISKMKANNSIDSIVSRLVFGAVVYFIWQERNTRMYKQIKRNEESLIQTIKETVRLRMMSFIVKESIAVRRMEEIWNVKLARVKKGLTVYSLVGLIPQCAHMLSRTNCNGEWRHLLGEMKPCDSGFGIVSGNHALRLEQIRVLIPETTFFGVESRVVIPKTTFVGVESKVLIPETTVWNTLVYLSDTLVIRKQKLG
ncbi:reverse transcriptase zinc-binding domain-containing protein [Tanacetum coccineum]